MTTQNPIAEPPANRRDMTDRRRQVWWALVYGNYKPRRRSPSRRLDERRFYSLDWYSAHLLVVSIGILLLSAADAFMTVTLMDGGATEVNPFMASVIYKSAAVFAAVKMLLTGAGVILLVVLAHYRFMRVVKVGIVMYGLLLGYAVLLAYEFQMLRSLMMPFEF
jgi:hypothetical protein